MGVSAFNEISIPEEVIGEPEEKIEEDGETREGPEEVSKLSKSGSEDEVSRPGELSPPPCPLRSPVPHTM